jgi:hypothetical protein
VSRNHRKNSPYRPSSPVFSLVALPPATRGQPHRLPGNARDLPTCASTAPSARSQPHRSRSKCGDVFPALYLRGDLPCGELVVSIATRSISWKALQCVCSFSLDRFAPRDAQRVLTQQESGLKATFLTLLLAEGRANSDPLPVTSARIERACEAPLAVSAARCASRGFASTTEAFRSSCITHDSA